MVNQYDARINDYMELMKCGLKFFSSGWFNLEEWKDHRLKCIDEIGWEKRGQKKAMKECAGWY